MAIRLSKASKEFNVGVETLTEFLHKKGHTEVEASLNTKITDEQYALLQQEFSKDKNLRQESDKFIQERMERKAANANNEKAEAESKQEEKPKPKFVVTPMLPKVEKPEPKAQVVTPVKSEPKAEPKPQVQAPKAEQPKPEPKVEPNAQVVSQPQVQVQPKPELDKKVEPIAVENAAELKPQPIVVIKPQSAEPQNATETVTPNRTGVQFNVVGKIDLSSINNSPTRPRKKTKEEKRKEQEEKENERRERNKQQRESAQKDHKDPRKDDKGQRDNNHTNGGNNHSGSNGNHTATEATEEQKKKKRNRFNKDKERARVDVESISYSEPPRSGDKNGGKQNNNKKDFKKYIKPEINDEDVAKQVRDTLARLTQKGKQNKGAKYRKEKREQVQTRQQELESQELEESMTLKLTEFVTANELATMMNVPVTKVIGTCMSIGIMVSINQRLDAETINLVAEEFGFKTEYVSAEVAEAITEEEDSEEDLLPRAPIVTVMGHVDHGKTSLLDYIRKANVIAGEAGGITQHIGAYNVSLDDGRRITFLDTPGHEAFTAMRARGAKVTDIAIIIVAADDNVMPQTKEAINHAQAAGVPIVFAINKIDKPAANPDKIKEALAAMNFLVEEWGGKYQSQDISAKSGLGVNDLMEKVLLEAEMLELKANPNRKATGSIIESTLDKGRGYVATVLVANGTLKMGDVVLAGTHYGKVKAMFNERNQRIKEAGPSEPVLILGLNGAPQAGDNFNVIESEHEAREIATKREQLQREQGIRTQRMLTLDEVGRRLALGDFHELNVIVKGDVDGSIEALSDSLIKLSTDNIQVNVIHKAVGQISESDVSLAAASNAIIIGFQVRPSSMARKNAEQEGVDIRLYSIIYDAIEDVKAAMEGMLAPTTKEETTATIEVREVFHISKVGTVAGAIVREGKAHRTDKARLIRDGIVIFTGDINALKRFKDDVKEVAVNFECGISLHNYNDIKVGDMIETFQEIQVKATL